MKIAMSGTYSTGKTTTTLALANVTGVARTHAKTMREILPLALPNKKLEDCTAPELFQLGIRRFTERAVHESHLDSFISDGSSLHEWIYGTVRMTVGINPNDTNQKNISDEGLLMMKEVIYHLGCVVKDHAKETYDSFIHLPVEFPIQEDGHRPVSEDFRNQSDKLLLQTLDELGITYHVVGGTIEERLKKIIGIYHLPMMMPIAEAIEKAQEEVKDYQIQIEDTFYKEDE
ncbi:MAG: ATP-binding protein [Streptococcaceae bacterium]|jgi:nicotinamide riboside kinase|nr:ATP-binding protein [Streptococcaceae bacterium]